MQFDKYHFGSTIGSFQGHQIWGDRECAAHTQRGFMRRYLQEGVGRTSVDRPRPAGSKTWTWLWRWRFGRDRGYNRPRLARYHRVR